MKHRRIVNTRYFIVEVVSGASKEVYVAFRGRAIYVGCGSYKWTRPS